MTTTRTTAVLVALLGLLLAVAASDDEHLEVLTCGSIVKLAHVSTGGRLHSHSVHYGSGSHQQSVTGQRSADDPNSFWVVRAGFNSVCRQGTPVKPGAPIRLQHLATQRWLHSHRFAAPLSNHLQEVSCFGSDDGLQTDQGDDWVIEPASSSVTESLPIDQRFRLRHVATDAYLASHDVQFGNPIPGQFEIYAKPSKTKESLWRLAEGIYFPQPQQRS